MQPPVKNHTGSRQREQKHRFMAAHARYNRVLGVLGSGGWCFSRMRAGGEYRTADEDLGG